MIELSAEDRTRMLNELITSTRPRRREDCPQPNISSSELAEAEGITYKQAQYRLRRGVEQGLYGNALVLLDGRKTNVYWMEE